MTILAAVFHSHKAVLHFVPVRCKAQCCSVAGTKFLCCCLKQTMAINTNLVFVCFDENVVEMRAFCSTQSRYTKRDQPCSLKVCTFRCMWCFLQRPLFDWPTISAALCLAALTLYSSEESRGMTKSCRGLFKLLSRLCLLLAECFVGGTKPDRRMSRYLQAAGRLGTGVLPQC